MAQSEPIDTWSQLDEATLQSGSACVVEVVYPVTDEEATKKQLVLPRGKRNTFVRGSLNTENVLGLLPQMLNERDESVGIDQAEVGPGLGLYPNPGTKLLLTFLGTHTTRGQNVDVITNDIRQLVDNVVHTGEACCLYGSLISPNDPDPDNNLVIIYAVHWQPDHGKQAGCAAVVVRLLIAPPSEVERLRIVAGI
jgi:hypothetical protein